MNLTHRKEKLDDLPRLIELLLEDELGGTRESKSAKLDENDIKSFHKIDSDPNQYLMVVETGNEIIGTWRRMSDSWKILYHQEIVIGGVKL